MPTNLDHSIPSRCHCEHLSWALRDLNRVESTITKVDVIDKHVSQLLIDHKRMERLGWAILALVFTVLGAVIVKSYTDSRAVPQIIVSNPSERTFLDRANH